MQHSKFYKDDGEIRVPDDIRQYLDAHFIPELHNLKVPHPKLLVVFSGGNAMGKSTISAQLAQDLQALVLSNDDLRQMIEQQWPALSRDEVNRYMWQYMFDLYGSLDSVTPNGLVVRDGIIDWYHDKILPLFAAHGYDIFIIAFDIPREKRVELVKARGDTEVAKVSGLLAMLDDHLVYEQKFRALHNPDLVITADNLYDHDRVVRAVQERLEQLQKYPL